VDERIAEQKAAVSALLDSLSEEDDLFERGNQCVCPDLK
jgi:hypothetical protein